MCFFRWKRGELESKKRGVEIPKEGGEGQKKGVCCQLIAPYCRVNGVGEECNNVSRETLLRCY